MKLLIDAQDDMKEQKAAPHVFVSFLSLSQKPKGRSTP